MIRRRIFSVITIVELFVAPRRRRGTPLHGRLPFGALRSLRRLWVLLDVYAPGSRQAQLGAGVLDGLGDEDVALTGLKPAVVVRTSVASTRRRIIACFL